VAVGGNMIWHIGKKISLELTNKKRNKYISHYFHGTKQGYKEHDITLTFDKDKSLALSSHSSEQFIYLYPEQVEHLRKIISTTHRSPSEIKLHPISTKSRFKDIQAYKREHDKDMKRATKPKRRIYAKD